MTDLRKAPVFRLCVQKANGSRVVLQDFVSLERGERRAGFLNDAVGPGVAFMEPMEELPALCLEAWQLARVQPHAG